MIISEAIKKKKFYFIFIFYLILMAKFGSYNDWDGLLNSSGSNLYSFIIIKLHLPSLFLIFFNVFIFSYFLFLLLRVNKIVFLLILINPLFFVNVLDSYNKFVFVIFSYFMVLQFAYKKGWCAYLSVFVMFIINPLYSFYSIAIMRFLSKKFIFSSFLLLSLFCFFVFYFFSFLSGIFLSNEKVSLLLTYGLESLNYSEGGFGISEKYLGLSFSSIISRFIGAFFPFFFVKEPSSIVFLFSVLNFLLLCSALYYLKRRYSFLFFLCVFVFVFIMTNYTRAFRHLYVFLLILFILNYYPLLSLFKRKFN